MSSLGDQSEGVVTDIADRAMLEEVVGHLKIMCQGESQCKDAACFDPAHGPREACCLDHLKCYVSKIGAQDSRHVTTETVYQLHVIDMFTLHLCEIMQLMERMGVYVIYVRFHMHPIEIRHPSTAIGRSEWCTLTIDCCVRPPRLDTMLLLGRRKKKLNWLDLDAASGLEVQRALIESQTEEHHTLSQTREAQRDIALQIATTSILPFRWFEDTSGPPTRCPPARRSSSSSSAAPPSVFSNPLQWVHRQVTKSSSSSAYRPPRAYLTPPNRRDPARMEHHQDEELYDELRSDPLVHAYETITGHQPSILAEGKEHVQSLHEQGALALPTGGTSSSASPRLHTFRSSGPAPTSLPTLPPSSNMADLLDTQPEAFESFETSDVFPPEIKVLFENLWLNLGCLLGVHTPNGLRRQFFKYRHSDWDYLFEVHGFKDIEYRRLLLCQDLWPTQINGIWMNFRKGTIYFHCVSGDYPEPFVWMTMGEPMIPLRFLTQPHLDHAGLASSDGPSLTLLHPDAAPTPPPRSVNVKRVRPHKDTMEHV